MRQNASKKNIQYPPQTGAYKVFVKDKSVWQDHSVARLQISVGNPKHTGDKFFALTEWAAARFDRVILIVSDTLQRHNIAVEHDITLDEAYQVSVLAGQRWLKENKAALDNLAPSQRVITMWDEWIMQPDYVGTLKEVQGLYQTVPTVRQMVDEKAVSFCQRPTSEDSIAQCRTLESSVTYIIEEVAAFAVMFKETRAVDIYPGAWFKEVFEAIAQAPESSERMSGFTNTACLRVDFTRNRRELPISSLAF